MGAAGSRMSTGGEGSGDADAPSSSEVLRGPLALLPGDIVEACGLTSAAGAQLNGRQGEVVCFCEDNGRFGVRFGSAQVCKVRPENLRVVGRREPPMPLVVVDDGDGPPTAAAAAAALGRDDSSATADSDEDESLGHSLCDSSAFGAFWVGAGAAVFLPGNCQGSCKGKVLAFDSEQSTFTVRAGGREHNGVTREHLRFDHEVAIAQVKTFNHSAGVLGKMIWDLGSEKLSNELLHGMSSQDELDATVAVFLVASFAAILENGASLDLPELAPQYALRLLDFKVTVDATAFPMAALILAVSRDCDNTLPELLSQGVSPHSCAGDESTSLHFAVAQRQLPACRLLLDARADPNAKRRGNNLLNSPAQIAASIGFVSGLHLLAERGANLNWKGSGGCTPFEIALTAYSAARRSVGDSPQTNAFMAVVWFLGQSLLPEEIDETARKALRMLNVKDQLDKSQCLGRKYFNLGLWQTVFCWMMLDDDLKYGQEGIVVGCVHDSGANVMLSVEFAGAVFDFPEGTTNVKADPPPQQVYGFRIGEVVFAGESSTRASEVTVLGAPTEADGHSIVVRRRCGEWLVVDAADLARDKSSLVPFRALRCAQQALCEAKIRKEALIAFDRLSDKTRACQDKKSEHYANAERLREIGAHRAVELSEADRRLQADMRHASEVMVDVLQSTGARLQVTDKFPPPIPPEIAVKGAKLRLHRASSLKAWVRGQLENETIHVLLIRAGWEPPAQAFPLVQEALAAARRAAAQTADLEGFVEVLRFCKRRSAAEQGLFQPIFQEALEELNRLMCETGYQNYMFGPLYKAFALASQALQGKPVLAVAAVAREARALVDQARQALKSALASIRKSHAGQASGALERIWDEWPMHADILEGDIEVRFLNALDRRLREPVSGQSVADFRTVAHERALAYEETAAAFRTLKAISFKSPAAAKFVESATEVDFMNLARNYKAMNKDKNKWPLARMRELFDLTAVVGEMVHGCSCGFRASELANSTDCPNRGLRNHIDFPPAACLPCDTAHDALDLDATSQYYFTPGTAVPFRHWALAAEIERCEERSGTVVARTAFGERVQIRLGEVADGSVRASSQLTLVLLYPRLKGSGHGNGPVGLVPEVHELSECDRDRAIVLDAKLDEVLNKSDASCEDGKVGVTRKGSTKRSRSAAVVEALLNFPFRSFHGYSSFSQLLQPGPRKAPGDDGSSAEQAAPSVSEECAGPAKLALAKGTAPARTSRRKVVSQQAPHAVEETPLPAQGKAQGFDELSGASLAAEESKDAASQDVRCALPEPGFEELGAEGNQRDISDPKGQGSIPGTRALQATELDAQGWSTVEVKRRQRGQQGNTTMQAAPLQPGAAIPSRPGCLRLRPRDIFFTHDSIKSSFKDGREIRETLVELQQGAIKVDVIPLLTVSWTTEDRWPPRWSTFTGNRRLWVFRRLEEEELLKEIVVHVTEERVPPFRLTTRNGGESVRVRNGFVG